MDQPTCLLYIDVENDGRSFTNWEFELGSPNTLIRYRWTRDTMKVGDEVVVEGYLARGGTNLANAKTVRFADGRIVNAGSSSNLSSTQ